MPHGTKIATCSYCGTRAALVLKGEVHHELSCSSCGAPLHDLKMLPAAKVATHRDNPRLPNKQKKSKVTPAAHYEYKSKKKKKKSRKGFAFRMLEEAFDVIEDIFD